jgi:hypothetical protein
MALFRNRIRWSVYFKILEHNWINEHMLGCVGSFVTNTCIPTCNAAK